MSQHKFVLRSVGRYGSEIWKKRLRIIKNQISSRISNKTTAMCRFLICEYRLASNALPYNLQYHNGDGYLLFTMQHTLFNFIFKKNLFLIL